ncbi:hypothetical protein AOQ84DRAFT_377744 [Glonium stellatum]|uniref:DUF4211 domain-containing protein n=1 Tax=Glonium stellatum TaxID=574774 RepID=A0A8E2EYR9_9PEZI|nr:hypothetical protein AOQ84DRAFT_377744 [Glonium stellatum]
MKSAAPPSRRKRQSRLNFTPFSSSSPAIAHVSHQYQGRAAAVTYDGSPSPSKRQRLRETHAQDPIPDIAYDVALDKGDHQVLPTPEPSSQLNATERTPNVRLGYPVQRKLDFVSNDEDKFAQGKSGLNVAPPVQLKTRRRSVMLDSSHPETVELSSNSSSSEDLPSRTPVRRSARVAQTSVNPRALRQATGDIPGIRTEVRINSRLQSARKATSIELSVGDNRSSKKSESEMSSDEMPTSSPTKRRRRYPSRTVRERSNSFEVDDSEAEDTEEHGFVSSRKIIQCPLGEHSQAFEGEDEDEDEVVITRRKRRPQILDRCLSRQEKEELDEDLRFLGSPKQLSGKTRGNLKTAKQNVRQKALETLKRRRAGEKAELPVRVDQSKKAPSRGLYDTEPDSDEYDEIDNEEDNDEDYNRPHASIHSADALDMFREDDEDDGFVIEEEEDILGAPVELPLQFSNFNRMKGRDLFKYAVEWMVQKKINPAFAINDEKYDLAFRKLDDEVKGLAGSKFTSSVWTPSFTKALKARPKIVLLELSKETRNVMSPHCEACNRRTHPATWSIQFIGKPYHHSNLEELSDNEDEDEGRNQVTYDSDGRSVPDEDVTYTVGRFCMRNAQMAHTLNHWRYHLNEWVVDYLTKEGYCAPKRIVERDSWSTRKKRDYANQVVDEMEEKDEIRRLHRDYRTQIDFALEAEEQKLRGRR